MGIHGVPKSLVQICKHSTWSKPLNKACIVRNCDKLKNVLPSSLHRLDCLCSSKITNYVLLRNRKKSFSTFQQCWRPELNWHVWDLAGQLHCRYNHVVTFLQKRQKFRKCLQIFCKTSPHLKTCTQKRVGLKIQCSFICTRVMRTLQSTKKQRNLLTNDKETKC